LVSKEDVGRSVPKSSKRPVGRPKKAASGQRKQIIARATPAPKTPKKAASDKAIARSAQPGISITVQIPALRRSKASAAAKSVKSPDKVAQKRKSWAPVLIVLFLVLTPVGVMLLPHKKQVDQGHAAAEAAVRTTPDYQPLLPSDDTLTSKNYDGKRNMVSYTTTFSGARVTVSEQALPKNFTNDPAALLRSADSINAKHRVDSARGAVFVATNDVAGDQIAIFADKEVLGFIHTDHKMDDTFWKSFVEQMKSVDWQNVNSESKT
jgi:hypothetical protein